MAQYVDVSLDKARRLRFTINAIRELERHFDTSFSNILGGGNMGFEQIIQMLTVGLKYGDSEKRPLTAEKVGDLVQKKWLDNGKELSDLTDIILEAMQAAGILTKKEEDDEDSDSGKPASGNTHEQGGAKELPNV